MLKSCKNFMSDEQKKEEKENSIEITAGGMIYNEKGEIFLMRSKKWKNRLVIPGGHVEKDESFVEAFKREIKEETNLDLENIEPVDFSEAINADDFWRPAHFIHLHFAAKAINPAEVELNDEGQEFVWMTPEEALKRDDLAVRETIENFICFKECSIAQQAEYLNNWKRALADYDNLKRETAKEKAEMVKFAQGLAAMNFIEVYDNYKKALAHKPDATDSKAVEQWLAGVEHIKKQFVETLKQLGIEEIKTVGEKFDPALHEAVGEETIEGGNEGEIVKEIEGGYKMGEKVIKAAKVIVSK